MNCNVSWARGIPFPLLLGSLVSFIIIPVCTSAQGMRMEKGEIASCTIKIGSDKIRSVTGRTYKVEPNLIGLFNQVSNVRPSEQALIEIMYPSANVGEKVVVIVLDGGKLDNGKGVKAVVLNSMNKCSFGFWVGNDAGLYRLLLRKVNDVKIVQLWVGPELTAARK
jgi:hypothetical protein